MARILQFGAWTWARISDASVAGWLWGLPMSGGFTYWAWVSQWGYLPIALTGLGVFVATIWGINGIIWFNRQRQPGKARVAFDYRYGLALHAVHLGRDEEKEEASFQLGLILHNAVDWPMKYHVEDMIIIVGDRTIANPNFANLGGLISRGCYTTFYYSPFAKTVERPRANGIIKFTIAYGHPDFGFSRRMKKTLNVSLRLDDKPGAVYVIESESDENF